jgi:phage shock protein A
MRKPLSIAVLVVLAAFIGAVFGESWRLLEQETALLRRQQHENTQALESLRLECMRLKARLDALEAPATEYSAADAAEDAARDATASATAPESPDAE